MSFRLSHIEELRQTRRCIACDGRISKGARATLVYRSRPSNPRHVGYVHRLCPVSVPVRGGVRLYPGDTTSATIRMDDAFARAGL